MRMEDVGCRMYFGCCFRLGKAAEPGAEPSLNHGRIHPVPVPILVASFALGLKAS